MQMFHAFVEVDAPAFTRDDTEVVGRLVEQLEPYHGVPSSSPRGYRAADITFPAETIHQAAGIATAVVSRALGGGDVVVLEVMTEAEFDAREGWIGDIPELASVTQVAEDLGVTRAAILDRIRRGTLQAIKVGDTYAIPRARGGQVT